MTVVQQTHTAEALSERIFGASVEAMYLATIHMGRELGLYDALADAGPQTPGELAERTATDERYVREWVEHQAVGGIVTVDDASAPADERRYELPAGHAEALLDHESPYSAGPFAQFIVGEIQPLDATIDAFRTGDGVAYDTYPVCRVAQAEVNRPMFVHELGSTWIPALPGLDSAFRAHGGRVADVACGSGWSSIELARAYPKVHVDGYDPDAPSIELAEANLRGSGVEGQVRFFAEDGATARAPEGYDLVTIFEALHDMPNPVEVLSNARRLLAPGGVVLVADEGVAHEFHAPADQLEQLMYGFSVLFCLPTAREQQPSAATGTAIRPHTVEGYAREAGLDEVQILPIENDLWRFYLLAPPRG
jgi:2-polyprenyl-3-methyl-5-hydroxy-6-metoxy-1,4-benzoquinol methylase